MKTCEEHVLGNTIQGLKYLIRKLPPGCESLAKDLEMYARRLESIKKGTVISKAQLAFKKYSDLDLLTMLLIGEAEGEPWESKVGVGLTVSNRVKAHKKYFGYGWNGVMLSSTIKGKAQFSCFDNKSRIKSMLNHKHKKDPLWEEHWGIAIGIYFDVISDFVGKPLYYHSTDFKAKGWWLKLKRLGQFGNHIFYSEATPVAGPG